MFVVVKLCDVILVIPTCWLVDSGEQCFWPPVDIRDLGRFVYKRSKPEENWSLKNVSDFKGPYGKFFYTL